MFLDQGGADHHHGREWRRKADNFLVTRSKEEARAQIYPSKVCPQGPASSNGVSHPKYFLRLPKVAPELGTKASTHDLWRNISY